LHLDFVLSRFSESKLSPSARSNIDIDGLVGVVEQARVHGINGVNPVKVPVFNLGMRLDLEVVVDVVPLALTLTNGSLELLVGSRCRLGGVLIVSMKFNANIKVSTRNKGGSRVS